jgi:uncharacterized protein (TIGR04255 family)
MKEIEEKRLLPDFENPPVIEVVCGITFKNIDLFLAPHTGRLWERYRADYPQCQETAPLQSIIEKKDGVSSIQFQVSQAVPMPRIWFISQDGTRLIQVQKDRFLHNWRKTQEADEYPRFPNIIDFFADTFSEFKRFVLDENLGTIEPIQYELTYVNHLEKGKEWKSFSDLGNIFPDFAWRNDDQRFLPRPESHNWHTTFLLPDNAGRLHLKIQHLLRMPDTFEVIRFDLTARGFPAKKPDTDMLEWFSMAREWIVRGFADLTSSKMHLFWGRK